MLLKLSCWEGSYLGSMLLLGDQSFWVSRDTYWTRTGLCECGQVLLSVASCGKLWSGSDQTAGLKGVKVGRWFQSQFPMGGGGGGLRERGLRRVPALQWELDDGLPVRTALEHVVQHLAEVNVDISVARCTGQGQRGHLVEEGRRGRGQGRG